MRIPWLCVLVFSGFVAPLNSQEAPVVFSGIWRGCPSTDSACSRSPLTWNGEPGIFRGPCSRNTPFSPIPAALPEAGASSLVMEVYEMLHQQGAFGMYRLDSVLRPTTGDRLELPVENRCGESGCIFWRGPFLFRLTAKPGAQARVRSRAPWRLSWKRSPSSTSIP